MRRKMSSEVISESSQNEFSDSYPGFYEKYFGLQLGMDVLPLGYTHIFSLSLEVGLNALLQVLFLH